MLQTHLMGPIAAIQMCRDIVEGNFNAMLKEIHNSPYVEDGIDAVELQARIYTDFEILAMNQSRPVPTLGDMLTDCDPGDENDYAGR